LNDVPQPLSNILSPKTWKKAVAIAHGEEEMESILTCYFDPESK
jgi:hypothetical protein